MSIASITLSGEVGPYLAAMQRAASATQQASSRIVSSISSVGTVVGTVLGSAVVVGVGGIVTATLDAASSFQDLADATGASVENISGLDALARSTGHSFDEAASILVKFNGVLKDAKPGSEGERALKAIGLSVADLRQQDPAEALQTVAIALQGYADDGNKARVVQELFGKSIREAAPLLKDLAEGGKYAAKMTVEQVEASDKLNKQFAALTANATDLRRELVSGLVPAMSAFVQAYRDKGFMGALDDLGERTFKWSSNTQGKKVADLRADIADIEGQQRDFAWGKSDPFGQQAKWAKELKEKRAALASAEQERLRIAASPYVDPSAGGGRGSAQKAPESAFGASRTVGNLDGPDKAAAAAAAAIAKAQLDADVSAIGNRLKQLQQDYKGAEKVMDAERSAGLIGERDYYAEKRNFLQLGATAEIQALEQENTRLAGEKVTGKERIELDKKIAENRTKMLSVRKDADASLQVLSIQQQAALKAEETSFIAARQAAETYLATLQTRFNREVESQGQGDLSRQYNAGRNDIDDRAEQQRRDLDNRRKLLEAQRDSGGNSLFTDKEKTKYDRELALIEEFQGKSIQSYDRYWADLRDKQGSWELGAAEGWANYRDTSANVLVQTRDLVGKTFTGMEDALVTFATTGKLSFTSLANSIVADLIRIQVRAQMTSAIGGSGDLLGKAVGLFGGSATAAFSQTVLGASGFGSGLAYGNQDLGLEFDGGGYTGPGGKFVPAGIVHKGEVVWSQEDVARVGGVAAAEALRLGHGFADGGVVGQSVLPAVMRPRDGIASGMQVFVQNFGSSEVRTEKQPRADGGLNLLVLIDEAESQMADRVANGHGAMHSAITSRFGLAPTMG